MTEIDKDSVELRSRVNSKHLRSNSKERREKNHECNQFVVYHMCAGDTIQKIALKHNISVNELKRVNNLLSDQDIYALKMIRIPVHRFSFLTDSYKVSSDSASVHGEKQKLRDDHAHAKSDIIDLLSEVDQNVQRVKEKHSQQNSKEANQHLNENDMHNFQTNTRQLSQISWLRQNICHFSILIILFFMFVLLPLSWLCYRFFNYAHKTLNTVGKLAVIICITTDANNARARRWRIFSINMQSSSNTVRQLQKKRLSVAVFFATSAMSKILKKLKLLSKEDHVFKSGPVKNPTKYENSLREVYKTIVEHEQEMLRLAKAKEKSKKEIEMEEEKTKEELKVKVRSGDVKISGDKIKECFKKPLAVQRRLEEYISPEERSEKAPELSPTKTVKTNENVVLVEGIDLSLGTLYKMLSKMGTIVKMSKTLNGLSVYCEFDNRESAVLAQAKLNDKLVRGKSIKVSFDTGLYRFAALAPPFDPEYKPKKINLEEMTENAGNGQCVIQVKGRDLTSAILNAAFAHLGRIRNTCISRNRTTAILVFEREEAAQMAVDVMNGVIIGKDSVTISMFPDIKEKVETLKDDLTESKPAADDAIDDAIDDAVDADSAAAAAAAAPVAELDSVALAEPNPKAAFTKPKDVVVAYVRAYKLTVEMLYEGFRHFDDIVNLFLTDMRYDCLIEYKTSEQAYIALNTMNGHLLQNLALQISLLQENASTSGEHGQRDSNFRIASGKTISVRTKVFLPANIIIPAFKVFGDIVQYTFERNYSGGFVEFVNPACVSRACSEMNGKYLEDMKLITSVFVCSPHTNFNCLADPAMLDVVLPVAVPFKWLVTTFSPFGKLTYVSLEENGKSALIAYQSMESSKVACMELNGICFESGILQVNFHNESVMLGLRNMQNTDFAVSEQAAAHVNADFLKKDDAVDADMVCRSLMLLKSSQCDLLLMQCFAESDAALFGKFQ
ncbi:LysM and putative peptidoglycan-binding domain-containing protein 3 [Trichinella murrelli]|uniref:Negative elongation factor E n=1 Tax=Trichinella murrelli TaxID=144512 RepID=A0A0V0TEW8_9BILA|nr:LysM and putative peptidoglycan-binding domain-containing protein 3 [Trichinella murrelli]